MFKISAHSPYPLSNLMSCARTHALHLKIRRFVFEALLFLSSLCAKICIDFVVTSCSWYTRRCNVEKRIRRYWDTPTYHPENMSPKKCFAFLRWCSPSSKLLFIYLPSRDLYTCKNLLLLRCPSNLIPVRVTWHFFAKQPHRYVTFSRSYFCITVKVKILSFFPKLKGKEAMCEPPVVINMKGMSSLKTHTPTKSALCFHTHVFKFWSFQLCTFASH